MFATQLDRWAAVPTPFLALDAATLDRNLTRAQGFCADRGLALRPHAKTHKLAEVAHRQVSLGARGLTVASIGEAEHFAARGLQDLFIAYSVFGTSESARRISRLGDRSEVLLAVDSAESVRSLRRQAMQRMSHLSLVVEVDSGLRRTGVAPPAAGALAREAVDAGFDVRGVFTYPGHGYGPGLAERAAADESRALRTAVDAFEQAGVPCDVVSGGSTPTLFHTERGPVTEIRPGVYPFNDMQQVSLGTSRTEDVALAAVATVISVPDRHRFVLDAGSKTIASDRPGWVQGHGTVPGMSGAVVSRLWEHHAVVDLPPDHDAEMPRVGDRVAVIPNHVCTAMNLADRVHVSSDSGLETWDLIARGCNS